MNTTSKILRPLAALSLIAVGLSGVSPAIATETIDLTPDLTLQWNEGQVTDAEFDPLGRLWVWNRPFSPSLPYGQQVNVFVQQSENEWHHSYRWKPRKFMPKDMDFSSNGTMYAMGSCKVLTVSFKRNGAVKKTKTVKFKGGFCPQAGEINEAGNLVLVDDRYIREYRLPLSSRSRALRTVTFTADYSYQNEFHVGRDGNVYISQYSTSDGVDIYTSDQQGSVSPARSFTIHPDYGRWYITDMSDGYSGNLYLRVNGDILVYQTSAFGPNQNPVVEYDLGIDLLQDGSGLAWDGYGNFLTVDYGQNPSLRYYFMSP
jgi:hypothetical protein